VFYINTVEEVCCGAVGTSGKVCSQLASHRRTALGDEVKEGLYIKAGSSEFYLEPYVPKKYLCSAVCEEFLARDFENAREVGNYFDAVVRMGDDLGRPVSHFEELENFDKDAKRVLETKPPPAKCSFS
jgi:hypothetical protein